MPMVRRITLRPAHVNEPPEPPTQLSGFDPAPAPILVTPGLPDFAAVRRGDGRRHVPSRDDVAGPRRSPVARSVRPAEPAPVRWALRREPQPLAALLSIPSHHEAEPGGCPGTAARELSGDRARSAAAR